jgi:hypothetical protein
MRSTGRFIWPAFYLALIFILTLLSKQRPCLVTPLLILAAVIQVGDTRAGWGHFSTRVAPQGSTWPSPMKSPLWSQLARGRRALRRATPASFYDPTSNDLSAYALSSGLATDAVYLARANAAGLVSAMEVRRRRPADFAPDAIWILDKATYDRLKPQLPCTNGFLGPIDGYFVFAPCPYARSSRFDSEDLGHGRPAWRP